MALSRRAHRAVDVERVTKRFYERFKVEHTQFLGFIEGITVQGDREWYTSVMLNRLMFIYFIQRRGFLSASGTGKLDGDADYLRNRLKKVQQEQGEGHFHSFYRAFLLKLFHDGLNKQHHPPATERLLGRVPYLNGSLFDVHELERTYTEIDIPDDAFVCLFNFFDEYGWHLDDQPNKAGNEINPDVLGYIFEKYINQKQMGAYYSKEDITEYISKNTVIPYIFEAAARDCANAFIPGGPVWSLLSGRDKEVKDGYIYDAVKHGCDLTLPAEIARGLDDVSQRSEWNKVAPAEYALPTETWSEVVARRARYEEVRGKIVGGEITSINDMITYNLNIRQFVQDAITYSEGPDVLLAFYEHSEKVTVLDPACGSGAFFFAVLNILEPIYRVCLERMQALVDERDTLDALPPKEERRANNCIERFRQILCRAAKHQNREYFIIKSILMNNLYGVDIMKDAIEICKLRLFLKLIAQVRNYDDIEPLPDIDFNIRTGNTLVGSVTMDEVHEARGLLASGETLRCIECKAQEIERGFHDYRAMQTDLAIPQEVMTECKAKLRLQLDELNAELNGYLAKEYSILPPDKGVKGYEKALKFYEEELAKWQKHYQPFHWFAQFYGIMHDGGFNVIIGNPPYVEYSKVREQYTLSGYQTKECGNIFAFVCERAYATIHATGRIGFIVPLSLVSTERMKALQKLLSESHRHVWFSSYDVYPSKLFEGAKQRLTIFLSSSITNNGKFLTTRYNRWKPEERESLFPRLTYLQSLREIPLCVIPKVGKAIEMNILKKVSHYKPTLYISSGTSPSFYVHRIPYNYIKAVNFVPYFWNEKSGEKKSEDYKPYFLEDQGQAQIMIALLNSNLFFWWWYTLFEGYHCGRHEIEAFPTGLDVMSRYTKDVLGDLAERLMRDFQEHSVRRECRYKTTGRVIYQELAPRLSKQIIDQVDAVLAHHYQFTDEELDYLVSYDVKYRTDREKEEDAQ